MHNDIIIYINTLYVSMLVDGFKVAESLAFVSHSLDTSISAVQVFSTFIWNAKVVEIRPETRT